MKLEYPFTIAHDPDGWLVVQFIDFEEAFTQGRTVEECFFNAQEVLSLVIEQRMANGVAVPLPGSSDSPHRITPDAQTQAALLVHLARGDRPLADLARALGTSWPSAKRLEDPRHRSTLNQIERAAAALGKRLVLIFEDSSQNKKGRCFRQPTKHAQLQVFPAINLLTLLCSLHGCHCGILAGRGEGLAK